MINHWKELKNANNSHYLIFFCYALFCYGILTCYGTSRTLFHFQIIQKLNVQFIF